MRINPSWKSKLNYRRDAAGKLNAILSLTVGKAVEEQVRQEVEKRELAADECVQHHMACEGSQGVQIGFVVYGPFNTHWGFVCRWPKEVSEDLSYYK